MSVLVTGANGQLGLCLQAISANFKSIVKFKSSSELDLTNKELLSDFFNTEQPKFCINCAAYTNVEAAEDETKKANEINYLAVKNLAQLCKQYNCVLIHISTDYVFNGQKQTAYIENDTTQPINVYGSSKLKGEKAIQASGCHHFIIRTSWLYSQYRSNFLNFVKSKIEAKTEEITITTEQLGTPTNANDLAEFICYLVNSESIKYGLYHFSNEGELTWYDFSLKIKQLYNSDIKITPIESFKTKAKRPPYSVLSKEKLKKNFSDFHLKKWDESLADLIKKIG
ncbi:dTDP-4-dehydrorhamnose reductase [Psychroflexus sp. ALD_RP9]|uniref:dTDP-4-dehydrorhamnose reductase n=1 Tax=Psychroflexus sp. ALD_RP9 TaxID=2777186 RepID=UPI001A8E12A7|nr:dTDP-4-dehydrorhamnose reductase [Psychroflexus sp. ALD_RP9]QSS98193.1 dTDP-4-dehydrorhamnose reductase [Psychroflexus sp. ALD_RP9]